MKYFISAFVTLLALALTAAVAESPSPPDLLKAAEAERPAFMSTWESLVNMDSETGNAEGLAKVEAILIRRLKDLGAEVKTISAKPAVGDSIVATFKGKGRKRIMLIIHYDTVFVEAEPGKPRFHIDDQRAYGLGIADAKGGVAMILHAVKILQDTKFNGYETLTVLFNPDEERSSLGSRALIRKYASEHVRAFVRAPGDRRRNGGHQRHRTLAS